MIEIYYSLIILLLILNILDAIFTYKALKNNNVKEANVVINFLMNKLGIIPALIIIKFIVFFVVAWFLYFNIIIPWWLFIMANIFYVTVVINNFKLMKL